MTPKRITELWAWVVTEDDGGEGVPTIFRAGMAMPLMGADAERMESLRPAAQDIADEIGRPLRLLRFGSLEERDQVHPRSSGRA